MQDMRLTRAEEKQLAKGNVSEPVLMKTIYAINKIAKSYRDKERELRQAAVVCLPSQAKKIRKELESAKKCKRMYYRYKHEILRKFRPVQIDMEPIPKRIRVFRSEDPARFDQLEEEGAFVWVSSFYRKDKEHPGRTKREIFGEMESDDVDYHYYLCYQAGGFTFHQIISEEDAENYARNLPVNRLDAPLDTKTGDLRTMMTVRQVRAVLETIGLKKKEKKSNGQT